MTKSTRPVPVRATRILAPTEESMIERRKVPAPEPDRSWAAPLGWRTVLVADAMVGRLSGLCFAELHLSKNRTSASGFHYRSHDRASIFLSRPDPRPLLSHTAFE